MHLIESKPTEVAPSQTESFVANDRIGMFFSSKIKSLSNLTRCGGLVKIVYAREARFKWFVFRICRHFCVLITE